MVMNNESFVIVANSFRLLSSKNDIEIPQQQF
ncbi:MAG: hypothetical protein KatS3mg068_0129 [Candidatus Sericytochromatia bacterium]|nr:MAG: hypothetical protein KatS3mg068_0129 [Candidatus Sericytochromatia bacterium]